MNSLSGIGILALCVLLPFTADAASTAGQAPAEGDGVHTVYYGSRMGMVVDIIGIKGQNTPHAVLRYRHTRANAEAFCREYVQKVTDRCVRDELKSIGSGQIVANCHTGVFTSLSGSKLVFVGPAPAGSQTAYIIRPAGGGEVLDGSMASGYPVVLHQFKALCPGRVPKDDD